MHLFLAALANLVISTPSNIDPPIPPLVPKRTGCGTGCIINHEALSKPENLKRGWRRVLVRSKMYIWNYKTRMFENKHANDYFLEEKTNPTWEKYVYAHCKRKKVILDGNLKAEQLDVVTKDGRPITTTASRAPFWFYEGLCPKQARRIVEPNPIIQDFNRILQNLEKNKRYRLDK